MSELTWIALPAGIAQSGRRLAVLVLPRLDQGGTLADAGLVRWPPPSLEQLPLEALFVDEVGSQQTVQLGPATWSPQPGLWTKVFPADIAVRGQPRRRDAGTRVKVRKLAGVADAVNKTFESVASVDVSAGDVQNALAAAVDGELRMRWSGTDDAALPPLPPAAPNRPRPHREPPDFNEKLALMREHPSVLRALGLLFEVVVPEPVFAQGRVKVRPAVRLPAGLPPSVSPSTIYDSGFRAAPKRDSIRNGLLRLDTPRCRFAAFDIDGANRRMRDAARLRAGDARQRDARGLANDVLPVLRSNGLALVMEARQADFDARLADAAAHRALASMDDAELHAEALMLGLRFDVRPEGSNEWFSLHRRTSSYSVVDATGEQLVERAVDEEGHLKAHSAVDQGGSLQADDVLMRWDGWSLAVERPRLGAEDPERPASTAPGLVCKHALRGKLPRLRFARSYRLRARVVDLAGNGVADGDTSDFGASEGVFYRRYQPIDPPTVVEPGQPAPDRGAPRVPGPGESVGRIVLRSDFDVDAAGFSARDPSYRVRTERQLLPPRAPLACAEQHGAFDGLDAERSWQAVRELLAPRDARSADDGLRDFAVVDVQVHARVEKGAPPSADKPRAWAEDWPIVQSKVVSLQERRGDEPLLDWTVEGGVDTLRVSLDKAEAVTLELSSSPKGGLLDEFAVFEHLTEDSKSVLRNGRHPLVNPPVTIELVHAVRRPLRVPRAEIELAPRKPGDTAISLRPSTPLFGADSASCGHLELLATWAERSDGRNGQVKAAVSIQAAPLERGDTDLAGPLRHDFGDTKHRRVRCVVRAHSRFRDCFLADEDERAFRADSPEAMELIVPSTARPPAVEVVDVVPAFRWRDGPAQPDVVVHRIREGGVLQVELKRPWFDTGDGEQLAVVVLNGAPPRPGLDWHITQCGSDPLRGGANAPRFPSAELFAPDSPLRMVWLEEIQAEVGVIGFSPRFDGGRCVADVAIPKLAEHSQMPFVRLALARWQPDSLPRLALSPVVRSRLVPVWPRRELLVRRIDGGYSAELQGLGAGASIEIERLHGADRGAPVDISALTPPAPGVAAWVPAEGVSRRFVGSAQEFRLPPGLTGPLRLRIVESDLASADGAEQGLLSSRVLFADTVELPD